MQPPGRARVFKLQQTVDDSRKCPTATATPEGPGIPVTKGGRFQERKRAEQDYTTLLGAYAGSHSGQSRKNVMSGAIQCLDLIGHK
jgi:hypothetical protein